MVRTTETTMTFRYLFRLASADSPQPAGTCRLAIDEDEIFGVSFLAFRRTATMLHISVISISSRPDHVFSVNAMELEAGLKVDARV